MDVPLPYLYLHGTIYPKKPDKQNKVARHKCLALKNNINPTHPTSWTLSHPKALGLPKPQIPTVLLASSDSCPLG